MLIKKLELRNIRSYKTLSLNFPDGSVLLSGDIGSGKTTILLAIEFALFGLQPGQKGSALLRQGENSGSVRLEIEINKKTIILERNLKKSKNSVSQENVALITENHRKEMSITELKNLILSLLSYPLEFAKKTNLLYKFTVYTPQEEMKQIILEDSETRLNTLRHIFGIDKYKTIKENTSILTLRFREEIREKQGMIQDLNEKKLNLDKEKKQLDEAKIKITELKAHLEENQEKRKQIQFSIIEIQNKIDEKKNFEKEIEKTNIMLAGKKENINTHKKEKTILEQQIQELSKITFKQEEFQQIQEQAENSKKQEENLRKELTEIIAKINSLENRKKEALEIKQRMSNLAVCPTCLQNVNLEYKQNVFNKIEKEQLETEKAITQEQENKKQTTESINKAKVEIETLHKKISELEILKVKLENLNEKKETYENIDKNIQTLEKDSNMLDKHILTLKQSILELSKYENIFKIRNNELEEAMKNEKNSEILVAEKRKEIEFIEKDIENLEIEITKKEKIKQTLHNIQELESWLSNDFLSLISFTEKNVMLKLREQFSKLFNEWFSVLVSESLSVRLDENFTPIISQQDFDLDYSFLSGGERTAVALAYRLSLNQVINSLLSKIKTRDIVILDEPTDGFSEQQLDKMRDVLQQLNVQQLILVSHEQKIEGFVDKIIRFKKENNESMIEE